MRTTLSVVLEVVLFIFLVGSGPLEPCANAHIWLKADRLCLNSNQQLNNEKQTLPVSSVKMNVPAMLAFLYWAQIPMVLGLNNAGVHNESEDGIEEEGITQNICNKNTMMGFYP